MELRESDWYAWLLSNVEIGSGSIRQVGEWIRNKSILWREVACGRVLIPFPSRVQKYCRPGWESACFDYIQTLAIQNVRYLAWFEAAYPEPLKMIADPPAVLFWHSRSYDKNTWHKVVQYSVGVVGTRRHSVYGQHCTTQLVQQLALYGTTIVSGLALGIDAIAHAAALKHNTVTIGVEAGSLRSGHPRQNDHIFHEIVEKGIVCAEFPPEPARELQKGSFPMRNRIIAGLSQSIVVTEAPVTSGAIVTARQAISYSREVYIIPSDIDRTTNHGALQLAQRCEAGILTNGHELITQLGWTSLQHTYLRRKRKQLISVVRACVAQYTQTPWPGFTPSLPVEQFLIEKCGILLTHLPLVLLKLKMYGIITRSLKGQYSWQLT